MTIECGAVIVDGEDDTPFPKTKQCDKQAYWLCKNLQGKTIYRCFQHGYAFGNRRPIYGRDDVQD